MQRKKKLFALVIATVLFAIFASWSIYEHNTYVSRTIADYTAKGIPIDYIDYDTYIKVWYGLPTILVGIGLLVIWFAVIIHAIHTIQLDRKKTTVTMLSLILIIGFLPGFTNVTKISSTTGVIPINEEPTTLQTDSARVNCLIFFDEECTYEPYKNASAHREWWCDILFSTNIQNNVYWHFNANWNIQLVNLNGHEQFWNSDNNQSNAYYMLQEAIQELGGIYDTANNWWVWQPKEYLVGGTYYIADLLIVVTDQDMDMVGLSPPFWNAFIMRFWGVGSSEMEHEMGHQFSAPHCGNFCVMNINWVGMTGWFCDSCKSVIQSHREKWGYKRYIKMINTEDGYTDPIGGFVYEKTIGTNFNMQAFAYTHFIFDYWSVDDGFVGWMVYRNPETFTVDGNYTITPIFVITDLTISSGCGGSRKYIC